MPARPDELYSVERTASALWPPTADRLPEDVLGRFAEKAAFADEEGRLETSTLDRLRASGYFGFPVPTHMDGGGAGLLECAAVQRRLAMADPALAIAGNMHLFSVGMAVEHWLRYRDACGLLLEAIASQQRIVASAFAEPGLGGAVLRSTTKATRAQGGYVASGVKAPCSFAAHCDLLSMQMKVHPAEPDGLLLAVIPSATKGVRVEPSWDSLGMRASGSDTVVLDQCFVPEELVFHRCRPGFDTDEVLAAGLVWFCVTTTATYLGVAKAVIDAARQELAASRLSYLGSARADLATVQAQLGEIVAATLTAEAACVSVAARVDSREHDPRAILPVAIAVKHAAVGTATRAVEDAAELLGGRAYRRTSTVARLWRDVQGARFHPPSRLASRLLLGRWALGLSFTFELDESGRAGPSG